MLTQQKPTHVDHLAWVDFLRILACFLVVFAHCCDPFVGKFDNNVSEFLSGAYWGSLVRPCVPLFVMISGVLLLPVTMDTGAFYTKRLKRIIIPLIIWSILLPLLYFGYFATGIETINANIIPANYTWASTLNKLYLFIFNFNYDTTPLWYLYMLVGIYLFIPIIGAWMKQASKKDIKLFLFIWGISMVLPYIKMLAPTLGYPGNYGNMGLLGVCDWNPYGTFYYFSGFLGYIVLAHYLIRFPLNWSWGKTLALTVPLFLVGYAITAEGFILTQKYYPGQYANLEIIWYFSGINVFMMTFSAFVLIQKIRFAPSKILNKIAGLTFGIYLCHFFLVQVGYDFIYTHIQLPPYLQIPLIACIAFIASLLITWLLSLTRWTRKSVM
ncbi:MAG: acyltransferase [Akkermansia sp.]